MPAPTACCNPCDPETIVEVPGTQGAAGAAGAAGQGAYTTTTASFFIPAPNANVSNPDGFVYLTNTDWLVIGQTLFIGDGTEGATFEVMSVATGKIAAKALAHTGDTAAGAEINVGAKAVAAGTQPAIPSPTTVANGGTNSATATLARAALGVGGASLSVYAAGTVYPLTATPALLDFGTTDPSLVITAAGTWALFARARIDFNGLGVADGRTVTIKLRRTNNTAADLGNGSVGFKCPVNTTGTGTAIIFDIPLIIYVTTNATDILQIYGSVSVVDNAGNLQAVEASIVAVKLYDQTV